MSCLATELNAAYTYDNNGSVKTQTQKFDGVTTNDAITSFDDDPLNRLTKITAALAGITQYGHNGVDHLVFVNDPRTLVTSYAVDGLDNQKQLISPDTGTTNNIYYAAGNLKTRTEARAKVSTYGSRCSRPILCAPIYTAWAVNAITLAGYRLPAKENV